MTLVAFPDAKPSRHRKPVGSKPFTLPHFRIWSADLVLDSGELFVLEDFQAAVVRDVFTGIPEVWDVVPEGNGKSTLIAIIALYYAEFQAFAAIPVAAASREQAEIIYRQAEGFVLRTERLYAMVESPIQLAKGKRKTDVPRFTCLEGYRRINHYKGGRIQVFAADDRTGDGIIPTLGIIDEPHRQRDLSLYRTWAGKLSKRKGQIVAISTAGEPGSDFELTRERIRISATKVKRKGAFTRYESSGIVLHEWSLPEDADPTNFPAVKAANPFSGITIETLAAKYARPTMTLEHWLRFVCNRPTRSSSAAITEDEWRNAKTEQTIPEGEPVWLGLDVAWKWDTTSAVPLWWKSPEFRLLGPAEILVPPRDGSSLDPDAVEAALLRIHQRNPIHTVVMDMSRAEQLATWIEREIGARVADWSQGIKTQVEEYEAFMDALRQGWLHHTGDVGLTQHAMNAIAVLGRLGDAMFDRPSQTRQSAEQERRVIDALKASAMVNLAAHQENAAHSEPLVAFG